MMAGRSLAPCAWLGRRGTDAGRQPTESSSMASGGGRVLRERGDLLSDGDAEHGLGRVWREAVSGIGCRVAAVRRG